MSGEKVAVVTGANKGLGLEIVAGLCERWSGTVYLTARDEARGQAALAELRARGLQPRFHQLDVTDEASVTRLAETLRSRHGGLDLLVNNAGVANSVDLYNNYAESAAIVETNYRALLLAQRHLFPLLRRSARVLHISSDCGHLSNLRHADWLQRLSSLNLTEEDIEEFVKWHLDAVRTGTFRRADFADEGTVAAYRVSKIAVSALATVQARQLGERDVQVWSLHPGLVRTDMTRGVGFLSPAEAARAPLDVLLGEKSPPSGSYLWYDGEPRDWRDTSLDLYFRTSTLIPTK